MTSDIRFVNGKLYSSLDGIRQIIIIAESLWPNNTINVLWEHIFSVPYVLFITNYDKIIRYTSRPKRKMKLNKEKRKTNHSYRINIDCSHVWYTGNRFSFENIIHRTNTKWIRILLHGFCFLSWCLANDLFHFCWFFI